MIETNRYRFEMEITSTSKMPASLNSLDFQEKIAQVIRDYFGENDTWEVNYRMIVDDAQMLDPEKPLY